MKNSVMLACRNIKNELKQAIEEADAGFPVVYIPPELHLFPANFRSYIQELIDRIENAQYILLPMGMCGNGTIGLCSQTASIVLPKCADCIDLLLSGKELGTKRPTHSYFLTEGWLGEKMSIDTEYERTVEKYGKKKADSITNMIYEHYKYFTCVDTGAYDLKNTRERIAPLAAVTNMEINKMEGKCGILKKMARMDFDDNFVIVPPGETVSADHFNV